MCFSFSVTTVPLPPLTLIRQPTPGSSCPPLPDRLQAGGADTSVTADNRHIEIDRSSSHHAVGHVWDFFARHLPHSFYDGGGKNSFGENMLGVGQCLRQFIIRRGRQTTLLDQINHFG